MDEYVVKNKRKLRVGFTTGSCAAAAAAAAALDLLCGIRSTEIRLCLPNGEELTLPVRENACRDGREYSVIKDSGDDPDVTNHAEIRVRVSAAGSCPDDAFRDSGAPEIFLAGGNGVGTVTKKGLEQSPGMPAINSVPRKMIFDTVRKVLEDTEWTEDLLVTVSVPEGEVLAKKTFNPNLGIEGGISILGTSGRVEPMSERAIVETIDLSIRQKREEGRKSLVLVPGQYGSKYAREELKLPEPLLIQCSNYIGETLDSAILHEMERVLLVGNFGKLVKLAAGIMNTHSHTADGRWEILASHAALCGASREQLRALKEEVTTDGMLERLEDWGIREKVIDSILPEIQHHLDRRAGENILCGAVLFSERYGYLGQTERAQDILEHIRREENG